MSGFESGNIRSCFRAVVQIKLAEFVILEHAEVQREVIVSVGRKKSDCERLCEELYTHIYKTPSSLSRNAQVGTCSTQCILISQTKCILRDFLDVQFLFEYI